MSTLSLCMIVKDESQVIERCLRSVLPLIDAWTVVDTGSSDDTPAKVQSLLGHLPGQVHHRPWRNFAENRTEAFELNRGLADYHLVIDADDWLEREADFHWPELTADLYSLPVHYSGIRYSRPQVFRSALPWCYQGVVHEYADCSQAESRVLLKGLRYLCSCGEGARSRDSQKYLRDAQLLEEALCANPDDSRSVFYLAQSYRDAGLLQKALEAYGWRIRLGGWSEERYISHLERGRLFKRLRAGRSDVRNEFLDAYQLNSRRAEALVELAQLHRESNQWHLSKLFSARAAELAFPRDGLFVEESAYSWRAADELALASFYTGESHEARSLTERLLAGADDLGLERERLERNLLHYRAAESRCEVQCA